MYSASTPADTSDSAAGNLLQGGGELGPVAHDDDGAGVGQDLFHLGLARVLVRADVANDLDAGAGAAEGAALAVLDGDALRGGAAERLEGVQVDGRVGLAGGFGQRRGGREDDVTRKVLVLADLFDGGLDAAQRRRRDDGHEVFLGGGERLELRVDARAGAEGGAQLGNDGVLLLGDVLFHVGVGDLDAVALLQGGEHAAEVLADKLLDERLAVEAQVDAALLVDLVDEVGAGLKGELLGEDEGVVAVEEEGVDLGVVTASVSWDSSGIRQG